MSKQLSSHTLRGGKLSGAVSLLLVQCMMVIGPTSPLVVVVLLWLGYTWSALLLALLISAEQLTKARHSPLLCRFYLQIAGCFRKGVTLHVDEAAVEAMQQNDGAMWCMHPHGTFFGFGFSLNGAMRWKAMRPEHYENPDWSKLMDPSRLERMSGVMAPLLFKALPTRMLRADTGHWQIPLVRSFLFGAGCSTPATKAGMHGLMRQRADFGIITGGMEEVALYKYRHERVFIRKRAGFIKYALQHGYKLVLSYTFGEADTYKSLQLGGLAM